MWDHKRFIYIFTDFSDEQTADVISKLHEKANQKSKQPIYLWLCSSGGIFVNIMAVLYSIKTLPVPVYTIGLGFVASGAVMILTASTKRYALPGTTFMSHQPVTNGGGDRIVGYDARMNEYKYDKWIYNQMFDLFKQTSKLNDDEIKTKLLSADNYYSEIEALKYGLIDGILDKIPIGNGTNRSVVGFGRFIKKK